MLSGLLIIGINGGTPFLVVVCLRVSRGRVLSKKIQTLQGVFHKYCYLLFFLINLSNFSLNWSNSKCFYKLLMALDQQEIEFWVEKTPITFLSVNRFQSYIWALHSKYNRLVHFVEQWYFITKVIYDIWRTLFDLC